MLKIFVNRNNYFFYKENSIFYKIDYFLNLNNFDNLKL